MKAAHGLDGGSGSGVCSVANSCFGGGLTNDESEKPYQFVNVTIDDGIIDGYQQNFVPNTTLSTAESEVLQWMPKDATMSALTVDDNGGSCAMFNISSPTLATVFSAAPKIGDPQGVLGVVLSYTDANLNISYNPNNIQDASISVAPSDPTAAC